MRIYKRKLMDKAKNKKAFYFHLENATRISIAIANFHPFKPQSSLENLKTLDL